MLKAAIVIAACAQAANLEWNKSAWRARWLKPKSESENVLAQTDAFRMRRRELGRNWNWIKPKENDDDAVALSEEEDRTWGGWADRAWGGWASWNKDWSAPPDEVALAQREAFRMRQPKDGKIRRVIRTPKAKAATKKTEEDNLAQTKSFRMQNNAANNNSNSNRSVRSVIA